MTKQEALESLKFEIYEEGHCSYIEEELDIAIEALEKQIAKKIEEHNKTCKCRVFDYMDYECTQRVPYCCVCGQRIDWSEADD